MDGLYGTHHAGFLLAATIGGHDHFFQHLCVFAQGDEQQFAIFHGDLFGLITDVGDDQHVADVHIQGEFTVDVCDGSSVGSLDADACADDGFVSTGICHTADKRNLGSCGDLEHFVSICGGMLSGVSCGVQCLHLWQ